MSAPAIRAAFAAALMAALAAPALAIGPDEMLKDQVAEARARHIGQSLRCLVCQNESIDESEAGLARDLRQIVRERIEAGDTDQQVIDFIVARYGQFVLLKPPVKPETWILWFGPPLLIAGAGSALLWRARRKRSIAEPPLSPDEEAALARVAGTEPGAPQ
jgi:cytochrome c-type biogenesis protein CcmH